MFCFISYALWVLHDTPPLIILLKQAAYHNFKIYVFILYCTLQYLFFTEKCLNRIRKNRRNYLKRTIKKFSYSSLNILWTLWTEILFLKPQKGFSFLTVHRIAVYCPLYIILCWICPPTPSNVIALASDDVTRLKKEISLSNMTLWDDIRVGRSPPANSISLPFKWNN